MSYHSNTQSPQFDVSFPEKLLKIVATRGGIFSLKFTKYRLAAGLCPDPLGELKRSVRPPSDNKEDLLLRGGKETRRDGRGEGGKSHILLPNFFCTFSNILSSSHTLVIAVIAVIAASMADWR